MNDIQPPSRPEPAAKPAKSPSVPDDHLLSPPPTELLIEDHASVLKPLHHKRRRVLRLLTTLVVTGVIVIGGSLLWYTEQLKPVAANKTNVKDRVVIESGLTPRGIASKLKEQGLIRDPLAFLVFAKLNQVENKLQAGTYSLSPSYSVGEIIDHLVSGKVDEFTITFLPGATLSENKKVLLKAGYEEAEIDRAFREVDSLPLFDSKPKDSSLEGYIYGETYAFPTSATVDDVLARTFTEFQSVLMANNLKERFKKQGLSLYQGITLASIIQREVPDPQDQRQVAQVFLKRYREGMALGSDITAYYGADLIGVRRTVAVDTPYNTRLHTGLPPGPIATPGLSALLAVANPASGDYLYFLSGDDEITYFARTNEEHEANIRDHCEKKCAIE